MIQPGIVFVRVIQLLVLLACGTLLIVRSGMQISMALLMCICLIGLATTRPLTALSKEDRFLAFSLLAYPVAVLLSFALHPPLKWSEFDAPSRFFLVIPIFLYLSRVDVSIFMVYRWGCAVGCIGAAAWAVWALVPGSSPFPGRASNYFVNPVPFACLALILAFSALPDRTQSRRSHVLLWGCSLLGFGAAVASQSRGILLVIPCASLLYFVTYRQRGVIPARQWAWAAVGTLALCGLGAGLLKERIEVGIQEIASSSGDLIDSSMGTRLQLWRASSLVFLEHPLLGVGKGNLPVQLKEMANQGVITHDAGSFKHSHNEVLFLLAETGAVGALSVLVVYLAFLLAFAKRAFSADPGIRSAAYAGIVSLGAYIAFGLADSMLTQSMQTSFLVLTIVLLFAHIRQKERLTCQQARATEADIPTPTSSISWLILSHCFNMDGRAASQVITDKIPLIIERGIVPRVISAPMGTRATTHPHIQAFSIGPSALRFDARHLISQRWGRGIVYKLLTLSLSLLLAPLIVIERLLFGLQNHASWMLSAVFLGLRLIRQHQPAVIYSTGGAYSAHWAAYWLKRLTGVPWIAEIHDPMILQGQPLTNRNKRRLAKTEALICSNADLAWWLTQGALDSAMQRHPELAPRGFWVHGGANAPANPIPITTPRRKDIFHVAHFGSLSAQRSMGVFAQSLGLLIDKQPALREHIVIDLFGNDLDAFGRSQAIQAGVVDMFKFHGRLNHNDVFPAMAQADALLLIHGTGQECSEYIPAKTFEYFWTQRPVLACTSKNPELDQLILQRNGYVAAANDNQQITLMLEKAYLAWLRSEWHPSTVPPIDVNSGMTEIFEQLAIAVPQALAPAN